MTERAYVPTSSVNALRMSVLLDEIEEYDAWLDGWEATRLEGEAD